MRNWTTIVIHHSATPDGETFSWDDIRRFHVKARGWRAIGYHAGIERIDDEYVVLAGRPLHWVGAHCRARGMNWVSLGFCFVGNYDLGEPPGEMLEVGAEYIRGWMEAFDIPVDRVLPHRYFDPHKLCPGAKFNMEKFRELLKSTTAG